MEPQFLFETLLFYKSMHCYYKVFRAGDIFIGEPVEYDYSNQSKFPYFIIRSKNEGWSTEGMEDDARLTTL